MAWNDIDILKYRVDKIAFADLAQAFRKSVGMSEGKLRALLAEMGLTIPGDESPELFYVVMETAYQEMKQDIRAEPSAAALFGISISVALTEALARHRFELRVQNHNGSEE